MSFDRAAWWRAQFARLLQKEMRGIDPTALEGRWTLLASMTWGEKRPRSFALNVPSHIYHILDDADVRSKDRRYAERQWAQAREWLNA